MKKLPVENDPRDGPRKPLSPEAKRALAEAADRRSRSEPASVRPKEVNGRDGPEPIRYGDWEKDGIISDF